MNKLLLLLALVLLPLVANADDTGSCGTNVTYTYIEATHTLTISGTGEMSNYGGNNNTPWNSYKENIQAVTIAEGVTSIGNYVFCRCSGLISVTIPNSVTSIYGYAFGCCSALNSVIIGNGIENIYDYAFSGIGDAEQHISDVYCYAVNVPYTEEYVYDTYSFYQYDATLHVPAESLAAYKTTNPWSKFRTIVALKDTDPSPTGIITLATDNQYMEGYYTLDGQQIVAPRKGINIVRMSDGTVKKVVVK